MVEVTFAVAVQREDRVLTSWLTNWKARERKKHNIDMSSPLLGHSNLAVILWSRLRRPDCHTGCSNMVNVASYKNLLNEWMLEFEQETNAHADGLWSVLINHKCKLMRKRVCGCSRCLTTLLFNRPFSKWRAHRRLQIQWFKEEWCPVINNIIISANWNIFCVVKTKFMKFWVEFS